MPVGFSTRAKAAAYSAAIRLAIGSDPITEEAEDHIRIRFNSEQKKKLQGFLENHLKKGPGDVRIELAPVLMPIVMKRIVPLAVAGVAGAFVLRKKAA